MNNFEIIENIEEANAITHSGKFHIDDVFSTVFLINFFENIKLIRLPSLSDTQKNKDKIIYDIGKGEFDHHQVDALKRKNGITYSSFGLLWKRYGRDFLKKINCEDIEFAWNRFDEKFVITIDKIDNSQIEKGTSKIYSVADIISRFNPEWNSKENENKAFKEAVYFANVIFNNEIRNILAIVEANKKLKQLYPKLKEKYIILDRYIPYKDFIIENDKNNIVKFIIYPSKRYGYEVRTILDRELFPLKWHKLNQKQFYEKYKIDGMMYCHTNGKMLVAEDVKTAIEILKLV